MNVDGVSLIKINDIQVKQLSDSGSRASLPSQKSYKSGKSILTQLA